MTKFMHSFVDNKEHQRCNHCNSSQTAYLCKLGELVKEHHNVTVSELLRVMNEEIMPCLNEDELLAKEIIE